ncbi:MAG: gamma-glutamyltransferase [Hyphomicrobiaceae bacterium]
MPTHNTHFLSRLPTITAVLVLLAWLLPASHAAAQLAPDPEVATGFEAKTLVTSRRHMVVSANPYASDAGLEILRAGGSAVDAAVAVQMVLGLVEPQSSGIGGGAFLLAWDRNARRVTAYDGRETAPAGIRPDVFLQPDGKRRAFMDAVFSGESVGVPGAVAMLAMAHKAHGRLPWSRLFDPARKLATSGFIVSKRLNKSLQARGADSFAPEARAYLFGGDGRPVQPGDRLVNPAYAQTLAEIAEGGAEAFYRGRIAEAIVRAVHGAPTRGGSLSLADMRAYRAKARPPVCFPYRGYRVCGMGPPSSGALTAGMTMMLVDPFDLGRTPMNVEAVHLIAEAEKLAYADRNTWVADPDVVDVPRGLLDPGYLTERRRLIGPLRVLQKALAGVPPGAKEHKAGRDATAERSGTSHVSIVDQWGNAAALTTSIESGFGSGLMAAGFLLNNQLTDFSFLPVDAEGRPIANAVAPGKRPRSSMSPTLIFSKDGAFVAALGSPGGSRIPLFVVKSMVGLIDWKLDAQAAAGLANFGSRNGPLELEAGRIDERLAGGLSALGHSLKLGPMPSGTHIIVRRHDGMLEGGADPRREGVGRGD